MLNTPTAHPLRQRPCKRASDLPTRLGTAVLQVQSRTRRAGVLSSYRVYVSLTQEHVL